MCYRPLAIAPSEPLLFAALIQLLQRASGRPKVIRLALWSQGTDSADLASCPPIRARRPARVSFRKGTSSLVCSQRCRAGT